MGVIAEAVRHMLAAGMDHHKVIEAIAGMEAAMAPASDMAAERRRETDRRRKVGDWEALRQKTFERDGFLCVYCGSDVSDDPQCDHIFPISRGGENRLDNLATSCRSCNSSKGDRTPEEWRRCL